MGSSKSKIKMRLRSGFEYHLEQPNEPETSGIGTNEVGMLLSVQEEISSQTGDRIIERGTPDCAIERRTNGFMAGCESGQRTHKRRNSFLNSLIRMVRLIPGILGVVGGVSALLSYFMECNVSIHEISVTLVQHRSWLLDFIYGPEENTQTTVVALPKY